jgi:tetratricopeptide (TPR) repeat protein
MGLVKLFYDWDWPEAEREFHRALELDPGSAEAHHRYAFYLWAMGRAPEAIEEMKRARQLDPLSVLINLDLGRAFYFARRYDEAIEQYRRTLELDPNDSMTHLFLGVTYEQKNMAEKAIPEIVASRRLAGDDAGAQIIERGFAKGGYRGALRAWASDWEQWVAEGRAQPSSVAMIYARLGNNDKALEWFEKGFQERTRAMVLLKLQPQVDSLRSDPRFQDLLRRIGLPQ